VISVLWFPLGPNKPVPPSGKISDLYSGDDQFECRCGHRPF